MTCLSTLVVCLVQLVWLLGPIAIAVATVTALSAMFWMDFIPKPSNEQMHRLKAEGCME